MSTATATADRPANTPGARAPQPAPATGHRSDVRRTMLALLASALGVFPLCELFTDRGWLIDVWLTMLVAVGPAALLRRTRPASAAHTWLGVVLLVPWLTVNFLRAHAVLGVLPLGGAWHDIRSLMTSLHHTSTDTTAPVHTTVAVRLALCAVLGLLAALVDLLAVVGRHGALAGVPLLVVFTVSGAVPRHPVSSLWFALAAAGFLVLLGLDSSDDLQRWGHLVPRGRGSRRGASRMVSAQRIGIVAIALALLVPIFIPSDSRNLLTRLFHDHGANGPSGFGFDQNTSTGSAGIDPFAALHGELNRDQPVPLLDVTITSAQGRVGAPGSVQPFYLRTNVLSTFRGDGWVPGAAEPAAQPLTDPELVSAPGTAYPPRVVRFSARIAVTGLRSNPPVFAFPTSIAGVGSSTLWSPRNLLLIGSRVDHGQVIDEDVAQPDPTVAELRRAGESHDPALASWLRLPPIAAYVRNLTAHIVARARTPYARARAISDFFADPVNGFSYSLQTVTGDSGDDLTNFLRNRTGYCQQYAASMAVMLRLANVPSRVVLGYAHARPDRGTFHVTTFDAHAWVEAYFAGIGWVPFDPTPIAGITDAAANDLAWAPHKIQKSQDEPTAPRDRPTPRPVLPKTAPPVQITTQQAAGGGSLLVPFVVLAIVLALIALVLTPAWVRWNRRRRRLHRIRDGDTEALWAELADTTVDLGYVWSDARTPRQVARWLGSSSDVAGTSLTALTTAVERARYSPDAAAPATLADDLAAVREGLGRRRPPRERWRAVLWPASLGWGRLPVIGRWLPGSRTRPGHR